MGNRSKKRYMASSAYLVFLVLLQITSVSAADLPAVVSPSERMAGETAKIAAAGIDSQARVLVWGAAAEVAHLPLPGYTHDVDIEGNYAYVACGPAGLQIVDISNQTNPVLHSSLIVQGTAVSVAVAGEYAYIGSESSGLQLVDVSDPSNPLWIGIVETPYDPRRYTQDILLSGAYAYVSTGSGLKIPTISLQLSTAVLNVPLLDRLLGLSGTDIQLRTGTGTLTLGDMESGVLNSPSKNYDIGTDFESNGGTMVFPGGSGDGPLIYGKREDFKAQLNFVDSPAIVAFWIDKSNTIQWGSMISAGPHGPRSTARGGWSIYKESSSGFARLSLGRRNNPTQPNCSVIINHSGVMPLITDGKRHFIVGVYDPVNEQAYLYTDGIKSGVKSLNGCRADTDGDDGYTGPGSGIEWFSIGEAGQSWNGDTFFDGMIQDIWILKPVAIPANLDAIILEWYTLGHPGSKAGEAL